MFSFNNNGTSLEHAYSNENIPKSSLGYDTNNKFSNFPGIMSDGRAVIASWQQEPVINQGLVKDSGVTTNWAYRNFLTHNSQSILDDNLKESYNDVGYYKRFVEPPKEYNQSGSPLLFNSVSDKRKVRDSSDSDLKKLYLSREELEARRVVPSFTQEQLIRG
jgi:hypothetical protein